MLLQIRAFQPEYIFCLILYQKLITQFREILIGTWSQLDWMWRILIFCGTVTGPITRGYDRGISHQRVFSEHNGVNPSAVGVELLIAHKRSRFRPHLSPPWGTDIPSLSSRVLRNNSCTVPQIWPLILLAVKVTHTYAFPNERRNSQSPSLTR